MTNKEEVKGKEVGGEQTMNAPRLRHGYTMMALAFAILLHLASIGVYYVGVIQSKSEDEGAVTVRILKYTDLGPPPSLATVTAPPIAVAGTQVTKPSAGIPVPVPDAEVSPEQTIA